MIKKQKGKFDLCLSICSFLQQENRLQNTTYRCHQSIVLGDLGMVVEESTFAVANTVEVDEDFDSNHIDSFECNSLSASIINLCKMAKNVLA